MAKYRYLHCSFWSDDPDIFDNFSPEDKYFYIYLLTNPHTKQCGIYEISTKHMVIETGYSKETIETLLIRFEKMYKKIMYNRDTKEMAIKNWRKYNETSSPKVQACIKKELTKVKSKKLIDFMQYGTDTLSIPYDKEKEKEKENS